VDELIALGAELSAEFAGQFLGTEQELFVEGIFENEVEGLTPQYVRAQAAKPAGGAVKGDLVRFVAGGWEDGCLVARG
jgi:hypothetical protein